jgi:hypothetical protein
MDAMSLPRSSDNLVLPDAVTDFNHRFIQNLLRILQGYNDIIRVSDVNKVQVPERYPFKLRKGF